MSKMKNWLLDKIQNDQNNLLGKMVLGVLYGLSLVYRSIVRCRNWAYDRNFLTTKTVNANVISVGNLTTGGTGKTPFVIWLSNQISGSYPTAIVSRGYRAKHGQLNDEGQEISLQTDQVVQVQNSDRFVACQEALERLGPSILHPQIILDDGFQHRRLQRNLDIVLIDATHPFGGQHLLPRGLLREEINSIVRAHFAILTRSNMVTAEKRQNIRQTIQALHPNIGWAETYLHPSAWISLDKQPIDLSQLKSQSLLAFSGIGNPNAFYKTVQAAGFIVSETRSFEDHFHFDKADIVELDAIRNRANCAAMICTVKDLVKIAQLGIRDMPVFGFSTELKFMSGQPELMQSIDLNLPELKNAG